MKDHCDGIASRPRPIVLLVLIVCGALGAQTTTIWTGAASSAWNASANWTAGIPTATITARIPVTGTSPSTNGGPAVCRSLSVAVGATLTIAPGYRLDVHGNVETTSGNPFGTIAGGGTLRMVGHGAIRGTAGTLPNLEIASAAPSSVTLNGTFAVTGDLTLTSGWFYVGASAYVTVGGDARFLGGTMQNVTSYFVPGTLDVAGNVLFSGSPVTGKFNIRCGGNWTADESYRPGWGIVTLHGVAPKTITATGPNSTLYFNRLEIESGVRAPTGNLKVVGSLDPLVVQTPYFSVASGAEFIVGTRQIDMRINLTIAGTVSIAAGGALGVSSAKSLVVGVSGTLSVVGIPSQPAVVRSFDVGRYSVVVHGKLDAMNFEFRDMNAAGLVLNNTATFGVPPHDLRAGRFDFGAGTPAPAVLLDVRLPATSAFPVQLSYLTFENTGVIVNASNVKTSTYVNLRNWGGSIGGESFDNDPANRISWASPETTAIGGTFTATAGGSVVTLGWTSSAEVDVDKYLVERAASPGGPYTQVAEIAPVGPSTYSYLDPTAPPGQPAFYRLSQRLTHLAVVQLGTSSATPVLGSPPTIVTQPVAVNACAGSSAGFTVVASGPGPLGYQWWKVGSPNVQVPGGTVPWVTFAPVSTTDAGSYFVVVSNLGGSVTSASKTLVVNTAPSIVTQPTGLTRCVGGLATFSVGATGSSLRYQWWRNGVKIPSGIFPTLNIFPVQTWNAGTYHCVVSNAGCPSVTSNTVTLTVTSPVGITTHPTAQVVCSGGTATFTVAATGGALSYQWRVNGSTAIPGATTTTSSTLVVAVPPAIVGTYDCVVTNLCGSVTSASAPLLVHPFGPPAISTHPSSQNVGAGGSVTFTVVSFTPLPTYQWRHDGVPIPGSTASTLQISSVISEDAGTFDVLVTNQCGTTTSNPATLNVGAPPSFTLHPRSQILCPGEPVTFSVQVAGTGPITVWWEKRSMPFGPFAPVGPPGTSFTLPSMGPADAGEYRAIATGPIAPPAVSYAASLVAPVTRLTGAGPKDVACADLTGAPAGLDVIAASSLGDAVTVHVNDGTGTFPGAPTNVSLSAGDEPVAVAAGEFLPGAGIDVAVACAGSGLLRLLSNTGPPGLLTVASSVAMPPGMLRPSSIVSGDCSPTFQDDLVVGCDGGLLGQGGLAFIPGGSSTAIALPPPPGGWGSVRAVALGDLDGDGDLDLAAAMAHSVQQSPLASKVLLYQWNGALFTYVGALSVTQPRSVSIRDMDGNGRADICVTVESYPTLVPGGLRVFLHDANTGMASSQFTSSPVLSSGLLPSDVVAADLREDSLPGYFSAQDVVTMNVGSGDITFHEGFSGSGFDATRFCSAGTNPVAAALADLNGDFSTDVVVANHSSSSLTFFLMTPDPIVQTFGAGCSGSAGTTPTVTVVGLPQVFSNPNLTLRVDGALPGSSATVFYASAIDPVAQPPFCTAGYLGLTPQIASFSPLTGPVDGIGRQLLSASIFGFAGSLGETVIFQVVLGGGPLTHVTGGLRIKVGP